MGQLIGYARVNTVDQIPTPGHTTADQVNDLRAAGVERIFEDGPGGGPGDRPGLTAALAALREGDTLVVCRLDRLSRSSPELLGIIDRIEARQASLRSLIEGVDTTTPEGRVLLRLRHQLG